MIIADDLIVVVRQQLGLPRLYELHSQPHLIYNSFLAGQANRLQTVQERFQSSYVGSFSRRIRDVDGANDVALLKELYRRDAEGVIRLFESQPSLHSNPSALAEYIKALVEVDRLDESALLKTLQKVCMIDRLVRYTFEDRSLVIESQKFCHNGPLAVTVAGIAAVSLAVHMALADCVGHGITSFPGIFGVSVMPSIFVVDPQFLYI
ncbi:hypothetical protein AMTR_s00136p00062030 [Amborella trichopoda]|uniref:Uncharacterized protein n=1 Tax=Amborella trichopoda TaxID=13333 RepID=W1NFM9_AMBTC|nr:hypothetical protein AMTR_s00136p00062030 [Amborella trichopoda]